MTWRTCWRWRWVRARFMPKIFSPTAPASRRPKCRPLAGALRPIARGGGEPARHRHPHRSVGDRQFTLVRSDGALWYLVVCSDVRVMCVTYQSNDMQVGDNCRDARRLPAARRQPSWCWTRVSAQAEWADVRAARSIESSVTPPPCAALVPGIHRLPIIKSWMAGTRPGQRRDADFPEPKRGPCKMGLLRLALRANRSRSLRRGPRLDDREVVGELSLSRQSAALISFARRHQT